MDSEKICKLTFCIAYQFTQLADAEERTYVSVWCYEAEDTKEAREMFEWDIQEGIDELYQYRVKPMKMTIYETFGETTREHCSFDSLVELGFKEMYGEL